MEPDEGAVREDPAAVPGQGRRAARHRRRGARRPQDEEHQQAAQPGRDRDHRSCRRGPGQRGGTDQAEGRGGGQRVGEHHRQVPEPGPAAAAGRRHPGGGRGRDGRAGQGRRRRGRPSRSRDPVSGRARDREGHAAHPGAGAGGDGRGQVHGGRADRVVRREHAGVPAPGALAAHRRDSRARDGHRHAGAARPGRGARLPLPGGPGRAAALHPRVQAGDDRGGRRGGRADGGRLRPRRHLRRHGLGVGRGAVQWRRAGRARLSRRPCPGDGPAARAGPGRRQLPGAGHQRGRGAAGGRRQGREPDRGGGHPSHAGGVPGQGPAGDVEHVHHAPAGGREAGQRAGGAPAVPEPDLRLVAARAGARRGGDGAGRGGILARRAHPGQVLRRDLAFVYLLADRKTLVIDFRYHLVSIVAVFLALAIGIVLGSTELQGPAYNLLNNTTAKLQDELNAVSGQRNTAQAQASVDEAYAAAVEPVVLRGLLSGRRLLIVSEPGAQASVVSGITSAARDAGAEVTGQIALQPKFFDTSDTTQDALNQTTLAVAQQAGIAVDNSEPYQQQAAQVLATETLTKSAAPPPGQQSGTAQAAAQTMLAAYAQPATPATLAVVVTPQAAPADGSTDPVSQMLVPLAEELAASSAATAVAGSSAGSGPGSPLAVLRGSNVASQVSTVDDADLVSGQTVVIQALAAQLDGGKPGSYGMAANGASAVAPSPAPTPSPSASPTPGPATTKKKAGK